MSCYNCKNSFNKSYHAPRSLQCGHIHCHFCLSTIFYNNEVTCSTCKSKQTVLGLKDIPFNQDILESIPTEEGTKDRAFPKDLCSYHNKIVISFCNKCREFTCESCYDEVHRKNLGCTNDSLADGISSLSTGPENDHLNNLIRSCGINKQEFVNTKLQDMKNIEPAFDECLWNIKKQKHHLEIQKQKVEKNLLKIDDLKNNLAKCSSPSELYGTRKKIKLTLINGEDDTSKNLNLKLYPPSDTVWKNIPFIVHYLQDLVKRSRTRKVYGIHSEEYLAYPILFIDNEAWIVVDTKISPNEIPNDAFTFEINSLYEEYLINNAHVVGMIWGNEEDLLSLYVRNCEKNPDSPIMFEIHLNEDMTEELRKEFFNMWLDRKGKYEDQIFDLSSCNFILIHDPDSAHPIYIHSFDDESTVDVSDKILEMKDHEKCILISDLSNKPKRSAEMGSIKLDISRGYAVLGIEDQANNLSIVILKVTLKYVSKEFKVIGYFKRGNYDQWPGENTEHLNYYLKIW